MMDRAQTAIADQYAVALERRKNGGGEKSYTGYLYNQGLDKILKKCGEETFEVCIAAKNDDQAETVGELNDVLYHVTVLLCFSGVTLERRRRRRSPLRAPCFRRLFPRSWARSLLRKSTA